MASSDETKQRMKNERSGLDLDLYLGLDLTLRYWAMSVRGRRRDMEDAISIKMDFLVGDLKNKNHITSCNHTSHESDPNPKKKKIVDDQAESSSPTRLWNLHESESDHVPVHESELVSGLQLKTPAKDEISRVMDQIKKMGVLIGKGGFHGNVFRITPPLCFTKEDSAVNRIGSRTQTRIRSQI